MTGLLTDQSGGWCDGETKESVQSQHCQHVSATAGAQSRNARAKQYRDQHSGNTTCVTCRDDEETAMVRSKHDPRELRYSGRSHRDQHRRQELHLKSDGNEERYRA
jgi:hypothetical protein